jgi:uncharacterized membrane protein SpoIIM required for sporulation
MEILVGNLNSGRHIIFMLESIIKYHEIERRPWIMFLWAILVSSVGVLFSIQLSYQIRMGGTTVDLTGIFSVVFTLLPSVYFPTFFIKKQEKMDEKDIIRHYRKGFWARHDRDIIIFFFYFFGLMFSYAFWAFTLPPGTFQIQTMKVQEIRSLAGNVITGSAGGELGSFVVVLMNNMQVMVFSFIFSLLFGAGAVFIVVWNASILGVYIGRLAESVYHIPGVSLNFLPHGIPEIGSYLLASLSGGIISAAIIRGHKKEIILKVFADSTKLLGVAIVYVFLGALIETGGLLIKIVSIFIFYTIFIFMIINGITPSKDDKMPKEARK